MGSEFGRIFVASILPENDRQGGSIVTAAIVALVQISSSHQDPAGPPPRGNEHGATSALTVLSRRHN